MLGFAAHVEDAAVNLWVKGLDAAIEHLRRACQVRDIADREPGLPQGAGSAAG
jgi:hypothetical protein